MMEPSSDMEKSISNARRRKGLLRDWKRREREEEEYYKN
jgi:hypothetical protein